MTPTGTVYLLHFEQPGPGGAMHYLGFTLDLNARFDAHWKGRGAALTRAIRRAGGTFRLVATWSPAERADERRMKRRHQLARLCPVCRPAALARHREYERGRRAKRKGAAAP
jgi:predicted GIY-YIG superfamily endonuclease